MYIAGVIMSQATGRVLFNSGRKTVDRFSLSFMLAFYSKLVY